MGLLSDTLTYGYDLDKPMKPNETIGDSDDTSSITTQPMQASSPLGAAKPTRYDGYKAPMGGSEDLTDMTVLDVMRQYNKPVSYEEEIREAERQKRLGMLSDILAIGTDMGTMAAGRRIFGNRPSFSAEPDKRLRKLKNLQKEANMRYDNALLQARLADRQEALGKETLAAKHAIDNAKWQAEQAYKSRELARKVAKDQGDLANGRERNKLQAEYNKNKLANEKRRTDAYVAKVNRDISNGLGKYNYIYGQDGRETIVPKDKMAAAANYALGVLQEYYDETGNAKTLSEIQIAMDMIKNDKNAAISVVQRLVQKYPWLQDSIDNVLGYGTSSSENDRRDGTYRFLKSANLFPTETYEGPFRPQWQIDEDRQAENKKKANKSLWGETGKNNQNKTIGW